MDRSRRLVRTIALAHSVNPNVAFEVFIHKVDGDLFLTDEQKIDCQHEIQSWVADELHEAGLTDLPLTFYLVRDCYLKAHLLPDLYCGLSIQFDSKSISLSYSEWSLLLLAFPYHSFGESY